MQDVFNINETQDSVLPNYIQSIKYMNNIDLVLNIKENFCDNSDAKNRIHYYISLTTIPTRFFSKTNAFIDVLSSLVNQIVVPDKIFVSLCDRHDWGLQTNKSCWTRLKCCSYRCVLVFLYFCVFCRDSI